MEGIAMARALVDLETCTGCEACISACPESAIIINDDGKAVVTDSCTGSEVCVDECPVEAITLKD